MLAGARFGYDTPLAQPPRQKDLPDGIVDFVGARVIQVLAFEINPATILCGKAAGEKQRRRPAHIVTQKRGKLGLEIGAVEHAAISVRQLRHAAVEYFGNVSASEITVKAVFIYLILFHVCLWLWGIKQKRLP